MKGRIAGAVNTLPLTVLVVIIRTSEIAHRIILLFILSRTGHRPEILHRFADGGIVPESCHFCVEFVNLGFEFVLTSPALSDGLI